MRALRVLAAAMTMAVCLSGMPSVCLTVPAYAAYDVYEPASGQTADLTVTLSVTDNSTYEETPIEGADIALYKVADYEEEGGSVTYATLYEDLYDGTFEGLTVSESNELAALLAEGVGTADRTGRTDSGGSVTFGDLDYGIWLVVQTNEVEGYEVMSPYIIQIPYYDGEEWIYDVESYPKTAISIVETEAETEGTGTVEIIDTGDTASVAGAAAVFIIALILIIGILYKRKRA